MAETEKAGGGAEVTSRSAPGTRVLIVDDEPKFLSLLRQSYEARGLHVQTALTGPEAIEIALEWVPNVAVVDLHLEEIGEGLETVTTLRTLCPEARIVLVSGAASAPTGSLARDHGADAVVDKPSPVMSYLGEDIPESKRKDSFPTLDQMTRAHVHRALLRAAGNYTRAAELLDIHRRTLQRMLERWGVR